MPSFVPSTVMNPPTTQSFILTIGNGIQAQQSVSINVIVSQDGRIRLDLG